MNNYRLLTYTFIVEFRGGTYCSQVQAKNVGESLFAWTEKLKKEKGEIEHLGDKTIQELEATLNDEDHQPILLSGMINAWCGFVSTRKGSFLINIIQTDIEN